MKYPIRGWYRSVLAVALCVVMALCCVACDERPAEVPPSPAITSDDFLRADGERVKSRSGAEVTLRGVNAGGLFVTENWMNGFVGEDGTEEIPIKARDLRSITKIFLERFGEEKTLELWKAYRDNWWSDIDFDNCAAMGMNVIRLPFTYLTVDFQAIYGYEYAGKNYDFSLLDDFVTKAASRGIYTILDLHGAYGSQNGQDHSGEVIDEAAQVTFYRNEQYISLTADLWKAIAKHYKNNPAIAGYDILNEPGEKAAETTSIHFSVFDRIYDAIRSVDNRHIVIFESCWGGKNLPQPSLYGWENCMYSFHHYTNMSHGGEYLEHGMSWNEKLSDVAAQNFGVPLYMGEFTCYNDAEQWDYTLDLLNINGWHWTSWLYKLNNTWFNSAWGIVSILATDESKVNAHSDSFETILSKFSNLKTTEDIYRTDLGGRTLERILSENYKTYYGHVNIETGLYPLYDSETNLPLKAEGKTLVRSHDRNAALGFIITPYQDGDGTFTFYCSGMGYWTANPDGSLTLSQNVKGGEDATRFYIVLTRYGYCFVSYANCSFLYLDESGVFRADGKVTDLRTTFYFD